MDAMKLLSDYERLLQEYTYLSLNGNKPVPQPGSFFATEFLKESCA